MTNASNHFSDRQAILASVLPWAGSEAAALRWYEQERIPALGMTAEIAVDAGKADAVRRYILGIDAGGIA